jgi:hypothetical protein
MSLAFVASFYVKFRAHNSFIQPYSAVLYVVGWDTSIHCEGLLPTGEQWTGGGERHTHISAASHSAGEGERAERNGRTHHNSLQVRL